MRTALLAIGTITALLTMAGCAQSLGRYNRPKVCESSNVSSSDALKDAPVWVPGSPMREGKPASGICGDGSVHLDRLCVVAEVADVTSTAQAEGTLRKKTLRLLGEELDSRMRRIVGGATPASELTDVSDQLRDTIGQITDMWLSPNCVLYAVAEVERGDFDAVLRGPSLSNDAKTLLLDRAEEVIGPR